MHAKRKVFFLAGFLGLLFGHRLDAFAMGETGASIQYGPDDSITAAAVDQSNVYGYFTATSGQIEKIDLTNFGSSTTISIGADLRSAVIIPSTHSLYVGTAENPGRIFKIDTTSITATSSLILDTGESDLRTAVYDSSGPHAYFGTNTTPGIIVKVAVSSFTRVGALTLDPGEGGLATSVIDPVNHIAYFATNSSPSRIIKIDLTTFTRVGVLSLGASDGLIHSAVISSVTGCAYFGTSSSPGKVIEVILSNFTRGRSLVLDSGIDDLTAAVIDSSSTYAYFGSNTVPGKIARVTLSSLTQKTVSTLAVQGPLSAGIIDTPRNYIYFGTFTNPAIVLQFDTLDVRTGPPIFSTPPSNQTVHVGESATFSVTTRGTEPMVYQWYSNGVLIPGATSASYTTGAVTFADHNASITCVAANSFGSTTSSGGTLIVLPTIKVFPNPWRSDQHSGVPISFEGAAPGSTLKIFTLSMHWVATREGSGTLTWDRTNDAGQSVASGYYFYVVTTGDDRQTVHGKFALIK